MVHHFLGSPMKTAEEEEVVHYHRFRYHAHYCYRRIELNQMNQVVLEVQADLVGPVDVMIHRYHLGCLWNLQSNDCPMTSYQACVHGMEAVCMAIPGPGRKEVHADLHCRRLDHLLHHHHHHQDSLQPLTYKEVHDSDAAW